MCSFSKLWLKEVNEQCGKTRKIRLEATSHDVHTNFVEEKRDRKTSTLPSPYTASELIMAEVSGGNY